MSKIGFAVSIKTEEIIEEKINALPFLNVIIFQKNEKTVFIIIEIIFFSKVIKKTARNNGGLFFYFSKNPTPNFSFIFSANLVPAVIPPEVFGCAESE